MSGALKPAAGKPVPRDAQQHRGHEAALPMYMVRAPQPRPARQLPARSTAHAHPAPGGTPIPRNPAHTTSALLLALHERELTREQLARALERRFPGQALQVDRLITWQIQRHMVLVDDQGLIGLTKIGAQRAAALERHTLQRQQEDDAPAAPPRLAPPTVPTGTDPALLTASPPRMRSSAADATPPPMRAGADASLALPSRIGDRLHYRSGLVTELDGTVVRQGPHANPKNYRPTRDGSERARAVFAPH